MSHLATQTVVTGLVKRKDLPQSQYTEVFHLQAQLSFKGTMQLHQLMDFMLLWLNDLHLIIIHHHSVCLKIWLVCYDHLPRHQWRLQKALQ